MVNAGSGTVSVINTASSAVVAAVPVGVGAGDGFGVAITPDGTSAYVTNFGSNNVSVINTATNTVVATVPVGNSPAAVAFAIINVATNKDECKDGGWMHRYRADGSGFKNQGDCIQYVNTGN